MKNFKNPSGAKVREDFPGGWKEDTINKFTSEGSTAQENDMFDYIRKLANYHKHSSALTKGKLMQFVPADGVYVYFRYDDKQTVVIISNTNKESKTIDGSRFEERIVGYESARNIITGEEIHGIQFSVPANTTWVLEFKNLANQNNQVLHYKMYKKLSLKLNYYFYSNVSFLSSCVSTLIYF